MSEIRIKLKGLIKISYTMEKPMVNKSFSLFKKSLVVKTLDCKTCSRLDFSEY